MSTTQKFNDIISAMYRLRQDVQNIEGQGGTPVDLPWGAGELSFKPHSRGVDVVVTRSDGTEHVITQLRATSGRKIYAVTPVDVDSSVFVIEGILSSQGEKETWKSPDNTGEPSGYQWSRYRSMRYYVDNPAHPYNQFEVE